MSTVNETLEVYLKLVYDLTGSIHKYIKVYDEIKLPRTLVHDLISASVLNALNPIKKQDSDENLDIDRSLFSLKHLILLTLLNGYANPTKFRGTSQILKISNEYGDIKLQIEWNIKQEATLVEVRKQ